jgi:pSer/pThr/pTyr-binding forkhead associated (FHA) protein
MNTKANLVWKKADGTSVRYEITDKPLVFGRAEDADVCIMDEGMSRRHFVVTPRDNTFYVEDLSSTNGTWVNGKRLVEPHELKMFDRIRVGQLVFVFDKEVVLPNLPQKTDGPK